MSYQDVIMQVSELLERQIDPLEISCRLHIDISVVDQIITLLSS